MPSILLVVFVIQLCLHIINTFGANTINQLLWILYNKLPVPTSKRAAQAASLKREILRLKRELSGLSAQDDFARWAKVRRQHDKALSEFEKIDNSLKTHQTTFFSTISTLRWLGTNGLRLVLQFWHSKSPMFWVPAGWVPGYVEWILSFPRAPMGSVSINIWGIACASMIELVSEAITATYVLVTKQAPPTMEANEPMAHKAQPQPQPQPAREGKKEL
ncbi:CHD5-like protein-domain-containing protein [Clohesyomyces aquaticus]|uniref:CHD5-like protein-domain-containing protein n=1 Tax=Clohesyomyces aquaticus TaxID=1231657 RepID=A0A1Y1ZMC6_9PLEO|nr:CHD5-like protein-domain-containing protein [Clohesyomyces aquaticus]